MTTERRNPAGWSQHAVRWTYYSVRRRRPRNRATNSNLNYSNCCPRTAMLPPVVWLDDDEPVLFLPRPPRLPRSLGAISET